MFKKLKFKRLKKLIRDDNGCAFTCDIPSLIGAFTNCFPVCTCDIPGMFTAGITCISCLTGLTVYFTYWCGAVADCFDVIGFAFGK